MQAGECSDYTLGRKENAVTPFAAAVEYSHESMAQSMRDGLILVLTGIQPLIACQAQAPDDDYPLLAQVLSSHHTRPSNRINRLEEIHKAEFDAMIE